MGSVGDGRREHGVRGSRTTWEELPMKRVASIAILAAMSAVGLIGADALSSGRALAHESSGSPAARIAQAYYPPPPVIRPVPTPPLVVQPLRLMTPFPVVRIVGYATRRGARIQRLSVRAPAAATIVVRCRRKRCSRRSRARGRGMRRPVRFRRFERRLRAGTLVEVFVTRSGAIGKFTRFRVRAGRGPSRTDLCLQPGARTGSPCPE